MAILLDTHVIIWLEESHEKVPERAKSIVETESLIYVSQVSVWKMAIKINIGKLKLKSTLPLTIINFRRGYNSELLDIKLSHIYQTLQMPLHHRDPFDRLLIAQSKAENIDIISSDEVFDAYGIKRIW